MWCGRCCEPQFEHTAKVGFFSAWCDRRFAVCARVCRIRITIVGATIADKGFFGNKKGRCGTQHPPLMHKRELFPVEMLNWQLRKPGRTGDFPELLQIVRVARPYETSRRNTVGLTELGEFLSILPDGVAIALFL